MSTSDPLETLLADGFARRERPVLGLADQAGSLAAACRDMALRFGRGGRLLVFGNGSGATDAQHIAVEFVHPVIVGKRALPALSLVGDGATLMGLASRYGLDAVYSRQVEVLGRRDDIALGVSTDGDCANVRAGLRAARDAGLLTVALVGGTGGAIREREEAEHCIVVASDEPLAVKEGHVTAYHLLWELVHVFFDSPDSTDARDPADPPAGPATGVEGLYPFLYGGGSDSGRVLEAVADSVRAKVHEIVGLRRDVGLAESAAMAACARSMAAAFAQGGTLLAFGNGGSSTDAQDVVHTLVDPPGSARPLPALCLTTDVAVVTALSNDVSFDVVFSRQVAAFGRPGDLALALSTSGGSTNVLNGIAEAERRGLVTIGMAGYGGGRMAEPPGPRHMFAIPSSSVHRVQEVQTTLYHLLWEATVAAAPRAVAASR